MIYADSNGSYPLSSVVKEYLIKRLDGPIGNPNAIHSIGKNINHAYEKCREISAEILGADKHQVFFVSGASEGISQYIASHSSNLSKKILTSKIEHAAVRESINYLKLNSDIDYMDVCSQGLSKYELKDNYALSTLMAANNETGVIQPYLELAQESHERGIPFFCDTTQIFGKLPFNFKDSLIDGAVLSAHKIGALQGAGILLIKDPKMLKPIIFGGGQEKNMRSGTQNYIGVECMTVALQNLDSHRKKFQTLKNAKLEFEKNLQQSIPETIIFGEKVERLPNTTLLSIPGIHGQALQIELESRNIFVTTSSACADNEPGTSSVLKAMGYDDKIGRGVIRLSFHHDTSHEDLQKVQQAILNAYQALKRIKSF